MSALPFDGDLALFVLMREKLYSAVLCDVLDQVGCRQQAMRADIRSIYSDAMIVGRALTMQSADVYESEEAIYEKVEREDSTLEALRNGATLREVYDKYGVL